MPELVPATPDMLTQFDPVPKTVRAIAAVEGDQVLGVTGFYPQQGRLVLFAGITDAVRAQRGFKRLVIRCVRHVMGMARARKLPVCAFSDPEIKGSDVLLKHMGFSQTSTKDIWQWPGPR